MIVDGICQQKSIRQKSIDGMSVEKTYCRRMIYNSKKEHGSLIVPIAFSTSLISQESDITKLREYEAQ